MEGLAVGAHFQSLSESEEAHKQKLAELSRKTEELESVNQDLANSLVKQQRTEMALRNILAASFETVDSDEVINDKVLQYQTKRDSYFSMVRKALQVNSSAGGITLSVR